ncbi:MAG: tetratricopeptide repeat protein [Deltaproteobacteria bacterium]|nr:MAG: tetratricopeptide repeat protein [Deltaproteobacteria bacterium]
MRILTKLALGLALLGTASTLPGCGGGGKTKVEALSEEDMSKPGPLFRNGVQVLQSPNKDGAIDYPLAYERFARAAELGNHPKAHFNAGWTAEVLGNSDAAMLHYKAAYDADPAYEAAMFSYARMLASQGMGSEAEALYRKYLENDPKNLEVRNDLVKSLATSGNHGAALAEAQEILLLDPKNAQVYRNLAAMYHAQGNYGMAQLCSEKALALNEGDFGTYNNLGVTYLEQEDEAAAIEQFKTAIKLDPDGFEANTNLGFIALNSGDYALALKSFTEATKANPASVEAKLGYAVSLRGNGDFNKADGVYNEIIKIDPANRIAYYNAATLHYVYTKDFNKALKYLQAYVDAAAGTIGPNDPVFEKMDEVRAAKTAEEERIAEEKRLAQEAKEREERNKKLLTDLGAQIDTFEAKVTANADCLGPEVVEEVMMVIEQGRMVVEAQETSMAPDMKSMFDDYYEPTIDDGIAACGAGGGGGEELPAEEEGGELPEGEEAPAEEAPAEGGGE